jgi:hypothetical protein
MSQIILVKLKKASLKLGPFTIIDGLGNVLEENVSIERLIDGVSYSVSDDVKVITIESTGDCKKKVSFGITSTITPSEIAKFEFTQRKTSCLWRHLTNPQVYNEFYGKIEPYVIEYPFAYSYYDEILQNVKDYTKVYKYLPSEFGVFNDNAKVEVDNAWFNKAILYNGQQCSGLLELVQKPKNNLSNYGKYPIYNQGSKTILFTKNDNFYQYNTFWSLVKNKNLPLFNISCKSLSIDKELNQSNMDYSKRSFKKEPLRAKELKIRHILDSCSDIHLTSQFIIAPSQISYK